MGNATLTAALKIKLLNEISAPLRAVTNDFKALKDAGSTAAKAFDLGMKINQSAQGLSEFAGKIERLTSEPVKMAMGLEITMRRLRFQVESTGGSVGDVTKQLTELGTRGGFDVGQVTQAVSQLTTKGWSVQEALKNLPAILAAAEGQQADLGATTMLVSNTLRSFGEQSGRVGTYVDVMTRASLTAGMSFADFGSTLQNVGKDARLTHTSFEQTAAMLTALGKAGFSAGEASGVLSAMMTQLGNPRGAKRAADVLAQLGLSTKDAKGQLKDIPTLLGEVAKKVEGKNALTQSKIFGSVFGMTSGPAIVQMLRAAGPQGLGEMVKTFGALTGESQRLSDALDETAVQVDERLNATLGTLKTNLGGSLIPLTMWWKTLLADTAKEAARFAQSAPNVTAGVMIGTSALGTVATVGAETLKTLSALSGATGLVALATGGKVTAQQLMGALVPALKASRVAALGLKAGLAGLAAASIIWAADKWLDVYKAAKGLTSAENQVADNKTVLEAKRQELRDRGLLPPASITNDQTLGAIGVDQGSRVSLGIKIDQEGKATVASVKSTGPIDTSISTGLLMALK